MLDTSLLTPGTRCLYRHLTLFYQNTKTTANGYSYHRFRTQGGSEQRLGDMETARHVWMEINITQWNS